MQSISESYVLFTLAGLCRRQNQTDMSLPCVGDMSTDTKNRGDIVGDKVGW